MKKRAVHRRADYRRAEANEAERDAPGFWLARSASATRTIYTWKSKYGGMEVNEAQAAAVKMRTGGLKHLVADLSLA